MIPFLLSPIGKRIGAVVACAALVFAAYRYAYDRGHSDGSQDGKREQLEVDKKAFEQDRTEFLSTLTALKAQVDAKDVIVQQSLQSAQTLKDALKSIPRTVPQNATQPPADNAEKLADYDALFAENEKRKQIETTLDTTIQAQKDELVLVEKQRDTAIQFGNEMVQHYTVAYNAAQKKHSLFVKIISFGLVKDKKLNLPEPVSLIKVKP